MTRIRTLACLILTAWVARPGLTADAPASDPAAWAPADALLFAGITDLEELKAAWQRTIAAQASQDPQLKAIYEDAPTSNARVIRMVRERVARALGIEPDKLVNPFGGPMALFIAPPHEDGTTTFIRLALISGVQDAERMREYYRTAVRRLRERSGDYERQEFAGQRIDIFVRAENQADDADSETHEPNKATSAAPTTPQQAIEKLLDTVFDEKNLPPRLALCLAENRLLVATDETLIKGALRGWRETGTLADDEEYRYLLRKFKPAGQVRLLFNVRRVTQAVRKQAPDAFRFAASLGVDNIRSVLGHARYGEPDCDVRWDVFVHTDGEPAGLVRIFSMPNRPLQPTSFVPDDTAIYLSLNLDVPRLLNEIEKMLRQRSPEAADSFARSIGEITTADGQKINLREQLFANLGAPLELILRFLPPYGPQDVRGAVRVPIRNADQIRQLLRALAPGTGLTERELEGVTVFDLPFGGISVGLQQGQLVAGVQAAVERAVQQAEETQPLATSPRFKAVARFVPEGAWGVFYADGERLLKAMVAMARKRKQFEAAMFTNPVASIGAGIAEAMTLAVPPDKLDVVERATRYAAVGLMSISTTPDGIWLRLVNVPIRNIRAERE